MFTLSTAARSSGTSIGYQLLEQPQKPLHGSNRFDTYQHRARRLGIKLPHFRTVVHQRAIHHIAAYTNTVINALDARGLYTTNVGAEVTTRVDEASQRLINQYRHESMDASADVMEELADGTGGTFYNNNDLEAGLRTLISGPDYTYLLAFSTAKTKPGAHHRLKVTVNQPGLTVQARRGYSTSTPEKQKK